MGKAVKIGRGGRTSVTTTSKKMGMLLRGEMSVEDMDDEELLHMRFKNKNGQFQGRPPAAVPRELAVAAQRELLKRGQKRFETSFLEAINLMGDLLKMDDVDDRVRLDAAKYIVERVAGKTPDKVEVSGDAPWQVILQKIIVPQEGAQREAAAAVIPGEVLNDD